MRLRISRDQARGLLGGVKFELKARVELRSEEVDLIRKYRADNEVLVEREIKIPLTNKVFTLGININGLVNGQTFKCKDVAEILETEKSVKDACEAFKNRIEAMKHFGGEEVIEY